LAKIVENYDAGRTAGAAKYLFVQPGYGRSI
jgi:hypothetical protein